MAGNPAPEGFLLAGQAGKPHGLGGEVYVMRISDDPRRFEAGSRLRHENGRDLVVETARAHRDRFLVRFAGVESREEAELIRGALYVPAADARELEDNEYWPHQLIGCEVALTTGERVGEVTGFVPGPAQDLLEVETPGGTRLVPMVADIVIEVDVPAARVVLDPPAGLLEG